MKITRTMKVYKVTFLRYNSETKQVDESCINTFDVKDTEKERLAKKHGALDIVSVEKMVYAVSMDASKFFAEGDAKFIEKI